MSLDSTNSNLVLRIGHYLTEQLRHLLTLHNGQLPLDNFETVYEDTFGYQEDIDIRKIGKSFVHTSSSVVNLAGGHQWLVWAPSGRPYPPHRRGAVSIPPTKTSLFSSSHHPEGESALPVNRSDSGSVKSEGSETDWPTFEDSPLFPTQSMPLTTSPPVTPSSSTQTANSVNVEDSVTLTANRLESPPAPLIHNKPVPYHRGTIFMPRCACVA